VRGLVSLGISIGWSAAHQATLSPSPSLTDTQRENERCVLNTAERRPFAGGEKLCACGTPPMCIVEATGCDLGKGRRLRGFAAVRWWEDDF
jgi:hypothetical protein